MKGSKKLTPLRKKAFKSSANCSSSRHHRSPLRKNGNDDKRTSPSPPPPSNQQDVDYSTETRVNKQLSRIKNSFTEHLQTKYGGNKKAKVANQFATTFDKFLKFAFLKLKEKNNDNENWSPLPVDKTVRFIIKKDYILMNDYLLQFDKHLKSSSILNKWCHLLIGSRFFHFDCSLNTKRGQTTLAPLENNMKKVRKALVKEKNKDALEKNAENLIKDGKWPKNGLPELLEIVESDYEWAMNLTAKDFETRKTYNTFLSWLYSCYYVSSVQGRVGGIEDMQYCQKDALMLPKGHETSTNFKTSFYHSKQAVLSSEMSSKATELYVREARSVIVDRVNNPSLNDDNASLFLTFEGKRESYLGKRITDYFFMKTGGKLRINSTCIRSLYETTADELFEKGDLTLQQKNSVTRLGGHNGATVNQYYLKRRLEQSVDGARDFMSIVHGSNTTAPAPSPAHLPANDTSPPITPPPAPVPTNVSQFGTGVELEFCSDVFDGWQDDHDVINEIQDMDVDYGMLCSDNEMTSVAAFTPSVSEHPIQSSNVRGCAPLPLYNCQAGRLQNARRVIWTPEEINYTKKVYDILMVQLPCEQKRFICKYIWQHIQKDHEAKETIFHPAHLSNPQKLRHCVRTYIDSSV